MMLLFLGRLRILRREAFANYESVSMWYMFYNLWPETFRCVCLPGKVDLVTSVWRAFGSAQSAFLQHHRLNPPIFSIALVFLHITIAWCDQIMTGYKTFSSDQVERTRRRAGITPPTTTPRKPHSTSTTAALLPLPPARSLFNFEECTGRGQIKWQDMGHWGMHLLGKKM